MKRCRLRQLGVTIGVLPTGKHNAITDVPVVKVGHATIKRDKPQTVRTGVTVVVPRNGDIWENSAFAGIHSFNGNGEMTGSHWIEESGLLTTPIAITNTNEVGVIRDALVKASFKNGAPGKFALPVVAESCDAWLNGSGAFALREVHLHSALMSARSGPVAEGCVGGGTGMICHGFKSGIGTSSRKVKACGKTYVVGALVQANYGERHHFTVNGDPVGKRLPHDKVPLPKSLVKPDGSIIVILATDAPLIPIQCKRLARRATSGLARVGGLGFNGSGDIFLCFATGNDLPCGQKQTYRLKMLPHSELDVFFEAVAEAVEEAILNALCAAHTMVGFKGRTVHALPLDALIRGARA